MTEDTLRIAALDGIFKACRPVAVALSGGVDSMTLAYAAHRSIGRDAAMFHALSPAVPASASARVKAHAAREGWRLTVFDAGEFKDENYLKNPANRCFFCKSNLYGTLAKATGGQLFSGTNLDDLGDWRPGLEAARENGVRHPFVEAGFRKADIRALARAYGLRDLAELPSAPCLSSRVETGIRIAPETLRAIDRAETLLRDRLQPKTVRCRVRGDGAVIELDEAALGALDPERKKHLAAEIGALFAPIAGDRILFAPYRRGSAFLRETLHG